MAKFVKDKAHNRYEAYCCEDIDKRLGALEEALAALVAGTIPDGSVTLARLAADAMSYTREINKGRLFAEWVGTTEEYKAHLEEVGGEPLANVKYIITDDPEPARVTVHSEESTQVLSVGSIIPVMCPVEDEERTNPQFYVGSVCNTFSRFSLTGAQYYQPSNSKTLEGTWVCLGLCGYLPTGYTSATTPYGVYLFQRVA